MGGEVTGAMTRKGSIDIFAAVKVSKDIIDEGVTEIMSVLNKFYPQTHTTYIQTLRFI